MREGALPKDTWNMGRGACVCVSFRCAVVGLEIAVGVADRDTICGHRRRVNLQFPVLR